MRRITHRADQARRRVSSKPSFMPAYDANEAARAFGSNAGDIWKALSALNVPLPSLTQVQADYVKQATDLWNDSLQRLQADPETTKGKGNSLSDRRFAGEDWAASPAAAFTAQLYLLNARTLLQLAEQVQGDEKTRARIR